MSTRFFIAPYTREDWIQAYDAALLKGGQEEPNSDLRIDAKDYARALSERWPLIEFKQIDTFTLSWILPSNSELFAGMRGNLYKNLQVVSFNGAYKELFVNFILWHRAYVPAAQCLYIFNSSEEQSIEIKPDAAEDDVIKITGIID